MVVDSNDVTPRKRRTQEKLGTLEEAQIMQKAPEEAHIEQKAHEKPHIEREALEKAQVPKNCEISVSYVHTGKKWDQNNIVIEKIKVMLK